MQSNDIQETMAILRKVNPWFSELPDHLLRAIAASSRTQRLEDGDVVIKAGELVDRVFIILDGGFRVSTSSEDGSELLVVIQQRGDVFGLISVLDNLGNPHWVSVRGRTTCLVVSKAKFLQLIADNSDIYPYLMKLLCQRYRTATRRFEMSSLMSVRFQLRDRLLSLYYAEKGHEEENGIIKLSIGQSELAALLGASRSKVNKELKQLEKEGALTLSYREIHIKDPAKLL